MNGKTDGGTTGTGLRDCFVPLPVPKIMQLGRAELG